MMKKYDYQQDIYPFNWCFLIQNIYIFKWMGNPECTH